MTNGSSRIRPTVWRAFSDSIGSWNTICISRRSARHSRAVELRQVAALEQNVAADRFGSRFSNVRPTVVLPQPDSPTSPSVSPRSSVNDTPSTACTSPTLRSNTPARTGKCLVRLRTSSSGAVMRRARASDGTRRRDRARTPRAAASTSRQMSSTYAAAVRETAARRQVRRARARRLRSRAARISPLCRAAASSAIRPRVYGWRGAAKSSLTGACSATRPAYITSTSSQSSATTPKIVRDEDHRHAVLGAAASAAARGSAPAR